MNEPWKVEQLIIYQKSWERCSTTKQKKKLFKIGQWMNPRKVKKDWIQKNSRKLKKPDNEQTQGG